MAAKPPDETRLYEAALNHLARYAATEAGLARVLARKIDRWARLDADGEEPDAAALRQAKAAIPAVIGRLKAASLLNDEAFAAARSRRLLREGKSRRAALAHLAAKGVGAETARQALLEDPERELSAACAYLRRRRAGPFGNAPAAKILGALARAGFSRETSHRALQLSRDEAEQRIKSLVDSE